jgi:hypothetical protein
MDQVYNFLDSYNRSDCLFSGRSAGIATQMIGFYPGSKMPLKAYDNITEPASGSSEEFWEKPRVMLLKGQETEFYALGTLARILNRKTVTLRKWESEGILPKPAYILPSSDPRGKRRLYTKEQISGLKDIAKEEGILEPSAKGKWKPVYETNFRERAYKLFRGEQ